MEITQTLQKLTVLSCSVQFNQLTATDICLQKKKTKKEEEKLFLMPLKICV